MSGVEDDWTSDEVEMTAVGVAMSSDVARVARCGCCCAVLLRVNWFRIKFERFVECVLFLLP